MVLLRPGWEGDYEGRPPVYPIGCAGVITHAERLADGRFNIVLRGMEKFRIAAEDDGPALSRRPRRAGAGAVRRERPRRRCAASGGGSKRCSCRSPKGRSANPKVPSSMADEDLVNALAQYLEFDPVEKQALLERDGLLDRCRSLIELLEMKVLVARHKWDRDGVH